MSRLRVTGGNGDMETTFQVYGPFIKSNPTSEELKLFGVMISTIYLMTDCLLRKPHFMVKSCIYFMILF